MVFSESVQCSPKGGNMYRQLHLFEERPPAREWLELPADTRTEVLRLLARAAARMLRDQEEVDHDGWDHDDED
jgi:F0F1-type ATP synthase alpha subunit